MKGWHWQFHENISYLTCDLLQDWPHGFFTQSAWPRKPHDLIQILQPKAPVYRVKQVHGDRVLTPAEIALESMAMTAEADLPPADGVMSDRALQSAWVASADCTPVLIGDRVTGQVAAIHSGWRGTAQNIVPKAIERLRSEGSIIENLAIALGPAIAGKVYQVGKDVAVEVAQSLFPSVSPTQGENMLNILQTLPNSPLFDDAEPGKIRLDVRRAIVLQLEKMGIRNSQFTVCPLCTYQDEEHFFSYRRTQEKKVQWSGIVSKTVKS
ncbi:MAG: peptidoglycan editing factor PgeF [Jaaginema sp. PMC 1079.18]|nr:peptidoglycan editing factor PgeF [Jaaginema sp. PMC 1080.18]MEC4851775.1 peptidoglycan editing factor PgeF [Jaaginema sp. PMC 1079.18]MEC4864515.1 peptidoglycan editing factor PgeF [Jaaginema sp. PMC 1078.18]